MEKTLDMLHRFTGIFSTITTELEKMVSNLNSMSDRIAYLEAETNKLNDEKRKNDDLKRKIANLLLEEDSH